MLLLLYRNTIDTCMLILTTNLTTLFLNLIIAFIFNWISASNKGFFFIFLCIRYNFSICADIILNRWDDSMHHKGFPGGSVVKNLPAMQETWVQSLGWEDLLEEGMAIHSSIPSWRIPWTLEATVHRVIQNQTWLKQLSRSSIHYQFWEYILWWNMTFCDGSLMDPFHTVKKIPSISFARKFKITSKGQILASYFIALIEIIIEFFSLNHLMWWELHFAEFFPKISHVLIKIFQISRKYPNYMIILANNNISAPLKGTFHFIQKTWLQIPLKLPFLSFFFPSFPSTEFVVYHHNVFYTFTSYICIHK